MHFVLYERIFLKRQQSVLRRIWNNDVWVHGKRYYDVGVNIVLGCRQAVRHRTLTSALRGFKSHYPSLVFFYLVYCPSPPTAMAVIKEASNAPGGFGACPS